ncbi:MAG: M15 family metallopeptidase [Gaiellaceae bacterium]
MRALAVLCIALGLAGTAGTASAAFQGTVTRIPAGVREQMIGSSWHSGCPVPIRKLRLLTFNHWNFGGTARQGRLIVHAYQAQGILTVMRKLYRAHFPMRRVKLVDAYGGSDDRSMAANNTSAFNCRVVEGTSRWSQHAYGRAIDVNPVQNPYVSGSHVSPPAGERYVNRSQRLPGMIHRGDVVYRAFAAIGWEWGGDWTSPKDYQHFSLTGT